MFLSRQHAGQILASLLTDHLPPLRDPLSEQAIIGVGRGGAIVASEIASRLNSPLTTFAVELIFDCKDGNVEIASVSSTGMIIHKDHLPCLEGEHSYLGSQARRLCQKAQNDQMKWLLGAGLSNTLDFKNRRIIVVEEVTTSELISRAAAATMRSLGAQSVILATPSISLETKDRLQHFYDEILAVEVGSAIPPLTAIYSDFHCIEDAEVIRTLSAQTRRCGALATAAKIQ